MIKIFLQNLSASKFKESNFTNHRERGIVDLLINKFIGMNFSLSLSLSLSHQWSSLAVTMVISFVCKWSKFYSEFHNFVDSRNMMILPLYLF